MGTAHAPSAALWGNKNYFPPLFKRGLTVAEGPTPKAMPSAPPKRGFSEELR